MLQDLSILDHFLEESLRSLLHVHGHVDENACVHECGLGRGGDCDCGLHVTTKQVRAQGDLVQLGTETARNLEGKVCNLAPKAALMMLWKILFRQMHLTTENFC